MASPETTRSVSYICSHKLFYMGPASLVARRGPGLKKMEYLNSLVSYVKDNIISNNAQNYILAQFIIYGVLFLYNGVKPHGNKSSH